MSSSSIWPGFPQVYAFDGHVTRKNINFFSTSDVAAPWLQVKFKAAMLVIKAILVTRFDIGGDIRNTVISVGNDPAVVDQTSTNPVCGTYGGPAAIGETVMIHCTDLREGLYFVIQQTNSPVKLNEVVIIGYPTGMY